MYGLIITGDRQNLLGIVSQQPRILSDMTVNYSLRAACRSMDDQDRAPVSSCGTEDPKRNNDEVELRFTRYLASQREPNDEIQWSLTSWTGQ